MRLTGSGRIGWAKCVQALKQRPFEEGTWAPPSPGWVATRLCLGTDRVAAALLQSVSALSGLALGCVHWAPTYCPFAHNAVWEWLQDVLLTCLLARCATSLGIRTITNDICRDKVSGGERREAERSRLSCFSCEGKGNNFTINHLCELLICVLLKFHFQSSTLQSSLISPSTASREWGWQKRILFSGFLWSLPATACCRMCGEVRVQVWNQAKSFLCVEVRSGFWRNCSIQKDMKKKGRWGKEKWRGSR